MKTIEPMIGDWILSDGTATKVSLENIHSVFNTLCQPIPLTADILRRNGWSEGDHCLRREAATDCDYDVIELREDGDHFVWTLNGNGQRILTMSMNSSISCACVESIAKYHSKSRRGLARNPFDGQISPAKFQFA